jgi:cell division protease FtsH
MDGFEGNTGVIVLSATNRPDVLDSALLRPGRFDRRITVDLPDVQGRLAILRIYAAKMPLAPDVDLLRLARRTPGFSGADLKNLLNEAAIMTARRGKAQVTAEECADALDKIVMGPEKAGALTTPAKKALVAYHEAGHAIVGALMPDFDRVERISIIPRASSGGATVFTPDEGRLSAGFYSRTFLLEQLSVALGGRAAEELVYGREAITTGAASDLRAVTRTARTMVEVAGLSRRFQHASVRAQGGPAFLGRSVATDTDMAGATADEVDAEIRAIVDEAYKRSLRVLRQNEAALHRIADRLIERESMDGAELEAILVEEGAHVCADVRVAAEADGAESEPQFRDGILLRLGRRGDDGDGAEVAR